MRRSRRARPSVRSTTASRWTCARRCSSRLTSTTRWCRPRIASKACGPSTRSGSPISKGAEQMNATERLGTFVARSVDQPLAPKVAERAAACMLDVVALTLMARKERTYLAMRAAVTPVAAGPGTARIWTDGTVAVLSEAVTANALGAHAHFHDDSDHPSWSHPGSLIVPLAISLGEAT